VRVHSLPTDQVSILLALSCTLPLSLALALARFPRNPPPHTHWQAKEKFPKGFNKVECPSGKGYLRLTPQPNK
jgi:hypothetical protein